MTSLDELTQKILQFRDARDWEQYHTTKNLAGSLCIEAAEVLEVVQWAEGEQAETEAKRRREELEAELADVAIYLLLLAERLDIDLLSAIHRKLECNEAKYPVEKARGRATKYTDL